MANVTLTIVAAPNGKQMSAYRRGNFLDAPTGLTASVSGNTVTLSWTNRNNGVAPTIVQRSSDNGATWASITTKSAGVSSHNDTSLANGNYDYRVQHSLNNVLSAVTSSVDATVSVGGIVLPDANLVIDNFATSDLTPGGTSPDLNYLNRFVWDGTYRTFIGTQQAGVATKIRPGLVRTWPTKDFTGLVAANSVCFAFQYPDWPLAEQRFSLGAHYPEVWLRYWMQVPPNFTHGIYNNKWLAVWTENYDGAGDVTFQTRPTSGGSCKLVVQDGGVAVGEVDCYQNFIVVPTDRGRWMQLAFRFVAATSGANGVIQAWRRWNGENTWTQLYSKTNATFSQGGHGVHQGYILGSAEGGPYTDPDETIFLMQRFEASTGSLV